MVHCAVGVNQDSLPHHVFYKMFVKSSGLFTSFFSERTFSDESLGVNFSVSRHEETKPALSVLLMLDDFHALTTRTLLEPGRQLWSEGQYS
jgi:hypothetical protein